WRRSSASASANAFDHPCRSAVSWIRTRPAWNASLDQATAWGVRRTSATLRGSPLPAGREGTFPPGRRREPARPGPSTAAAEAAHAVLALPVVGEATAPLRPMAAWCRGCQARSCPLVLLTGWPLQQDGWEGH